MEGYGMRNLILSGWRPVASAVQLRSRYAAWVPHANCGLHSYLVTLSMDYSNLVTIEPGKRGGKSCVRSLRITVCDIAERRVRGAHASRIE